MTDNSTFREIVEETSQDLTSEETEEVKAPEESIPKVEQPEKVETFAEPVDEKSLAGMTPQQLLDLRKNWEAAYTRKRQAETQELKELREKALRYEQSSKQQPPIEQKQEEALEQVNLGNMTIEQYTEYMRQEAIKAAREETMNAVSEREEKTLATQAESDFYSVDERLNTNGPNADEVFAREVRREIAELLDQHLAETGSYRGFDTKTLTKGIVERKDKEIDDIVRKRTQVSVQTAKMRDAKLKKSEVRGTTSDSKKIGGDSFRDILNETVDAGA